MLREVRADNARVEAERKQALPAHLLRKRDGHQHVRGLRLPVGAPFVVRLAILEPLVPSSFHQGSKRPQTNIRGNPNRQIVSRPVYAHRY